MHTLHWHVIDGGCRKRTRLKLYSLKMFGAMCLEVNVSSCFTARSCNISITTVFNLYNYSFQALSHHASSKFQSTEVHNLRKGMVVTAFWELHQNSKLKFSNFA